jgi:ribonuclease-3
MEPERKQKLVNLLKNPLFNIDTPDDDALLRYDQALTHSSYANEKKRTHNCTDYEQLEFLGNYVLNFVLAAQVYYFLPTRIAEFRIRYPDYSDEALLSKQIDYLKSDEFISNLVSKSGLDFDNLILKAEKQSIEESIRASAFEALIGSIYLDKKFEKSQEVILEFYKDTIKMAEPISDWTGELQKIVSRLANAKESDKLIKWSCKKIGPDDSTTWYAEVRVIEVIGCEKLCGKSNAKNKLKAKQLAAQNAINNYFSLTS